jgi:hypothetical protein
VAAGETQPPTISSPSSTFMTAIFDRSESMSHLSRRPGAR